MSKENKKQNNFFKDVLKSIKDLDKYEDFAIETSGRGFKYILKLILTFVLITTIIFTYLFVLNAKNMYSNLKEKLPEFSYSNGIFETDSEDSVIITDYEEIVGKIIFDFNANEEKIAEYEKSPDIYLLLLKDRFILNNGNRVNYKYTELLSDFKVDNFTKQTAIEYFDNINILPLVILTYIVEFISVFIVYAYIVIIDVLFLIIFTFFVSMLSRVKINFSSALNISVHSITLSMILYLIYTVINLLTQFEIKYFSIMYYTISCIYVVVAILMIKTDLINRQIELTQIMQEQEKIRQEQEQEEKQEEEKNDKKENQDDEKKKKKDEEEPKDLGTDTPV